MRESERERERERERRERESWRERECVVIRIKYFIRISYGWCLISVARENVARDRAIS
jgi:hypothetical protein